MAEEGFCHGLELTNSAGGGFCGPFAQEGPGFTPIILLPKFAQFLFEQVGALERLIDFQASDLSSKTRTGLLLLIEVNGLAIALKARR